MFHILTLLEMVVFIHLCLQSKPKSVAVKRETVKDEPLSPKSEPEVLPHKGKKPRAKQGEGEKKVVVKRVYEKPGQTRETPSEVGVAAWNTHRLCIHCACIMGVRVFKNR